MIGVALAWTVASAFLVLGLATFPFPRAMSQVYGAPADGEASLAMVRATGLRDVLLGAILAGCLALADHTGAALVCVAASVCAVVDFTLVFRLRGWIPQLGIHAGGIPAGVLVAWLLRVDR